MLSEGFQHLDDLQERQLATDHAENLNLTLRAIRNVNQLITREPDRDRLLERTAQLLVETRGYHAVLLILLDGDGRAIGSASAGADPALDAMLEHTQAGDASPCIARARGQSDVVAIGVPAAECSGCALHGTGPHPGRLLTRLKHVDVVHGVVYASLPREFAGDGEEQGLFQELADDLSLALHGMDMRERLERERHSEEAEAAVRLRIAQMRAPEDLLGVVDEISNQLSHLRLTHAECSIQIVNAAGTDVLHFSKRTAGEDHPFFSAGIEWPRISDNAERFPWVIDVWRRRTPRYAPRGSRLGPRIGSVVDVPFSQGTISTTC